MSRRMERRVRRAPNVCHFCAISVPFRNRPVRRDLQETIIQKRKQYGKQSPAKPRFVRDLLDLLDALDEVPSWLLGDVLKRHKSSITGPSGGSSRPRIPNWMLAISNAARFTLPTGWCRERAAPPSRGSVVPLFKGFCSCDWPIAKSSGVLELGVVPGNTRWGHTKTKIRANSGYDPGYWRASASERMWSAHTTDQATARQAWLIPGKRPRKTHSQTHSSIQLGSPFVCFVYHSAVLFWLL